MFERNEWWFYRNGKIKGRNNGIIIDICHCNKELSLPIMFSREGVVS